MFSSVYVSYGRELDECLLHTVTGCSHQDFTVYNETIIILQSAIITQLCIGHHHHHHYHHYQQQQQQEEEGEENELSEQGKLTRLVLTTFYRIHLLFYLLLILCALFTGSISVNYPHIPIAIGKVWIYRLLVVCLCVCLYGYGYLRRG